MAMRRVCEIVTTQRGLGAVADFSRNTRCLVYVLAVTAGFAMPAYAADSGSSSNAGNGGQGNNGGYYGQFYRPGEAPAAHAQAPESSENTELRNKRSKLRHYFAPDAAALTYQPGFHGCAPTVRMGSGLGSTFATPPPDNRNRYFRYGISASETYTDNVGLTGHDKAKSDFITEVTPTIQACADGDRVKASLHYRLQGLYYANDSDHFDAYNNVFGDTTVEILQSHLFLAADSSYEQAIVNPSETYSESNRFRTGNRTGAWITNISPYWVQSLGRVGHATLRYRYGRALYNRDSVPDYTLQGVSFNLANPPTNTMWSWQFNVIDQWVDNDYNNSTPASSARRDRTYFDRATLRLGYQLNQSLQLFATGGAEDDYLPDGSIDRYGSALWNAGFLWASPNNSLEASFGHRTFGTSYSVTARHMGSNFDVSLDYSEDATATGFDQLNRGASGTAGADFGRRQVRPGSWLSDNRGVYIRKRLTATVDFDGARTHVTLQAYDGTREYTTRGVSDVDVYGTHVNLSYSIGPRTRAFSHVRWEHRKRSGDRSRVGRAGLGASYQLTASSRLRLDYSHRWRRSDTGRSNYDENSVTVGYSKYF